MGLRVGVGSSTLPGGRDAGIAAAQAALHACGGAADLVLVFATVNLEQGPLLEGVTSVTGASPLIGCSGEGVITQQGSTEVGPIVSVMAIIGVSVRTVVGREIATGVESAARAIADAVALVADARAVLLFPDGLKANASALVDLIETLLPRSLPILGGTSGEVLKFEHTYQYSGGEVLENAVVAAVIGGAFEVDIAVTHGCSLLGLEHVVTRAEGGVVHELDGRPAWEVLREYIAEPSQGLSSRDMPYLCLAQPLDRAPSEEYASHVIRVPLGLDASTGALFFPGALPEGKPVEMARRDADRVAANAVEATRRLHERHPGKRPAFVLQVDCAGRGGLLYGGAATERLIDPIQRELGKDLPWLGFHSYGEIAPLGGRSMFHQYTMALCAFYETVDAAP